MQTVLGVLVLKEMFDLTDVETLEELEFNLLWHHALRLEMEEAHLAQKTLHNFRVRLMEHDGGRLAFCETTDRIIEAMGWGRGWAMGDCREWGAKVRPRGPASIKQETNTAVPFNAVILASSVPAGLVAIVLPPNYSSRLGYLTSNDAVAIRMRHQGCQYPCAQDDSGRLVL